MDMSPFSPLTVIHQLLSPGMQWVLFPIKGKKKNQILRHLVLTHPCSRAPPGKVLFVFGIQATSSSNCPAPQFCY